MKTRQKKVIRIKCPECKRMIAVDPNGRLGFHSQTVRGHLPDGGFELTRTCMGFGMLVMIDDRRRASKQ